MRHSIQYVSKGISISALALILVNGCATTSEGKRKESELACIAGAIALGLTGPASQALLERAVRIGGGCIGGKAIYDTIERDKQRVYQHGSKTQIPGGYKHHGHWHYTTDPLHDH